MLEALPRLALAVLRHLIAYGELLYEEGGEVARRLRLGLIGFASLRWPASSRSSSPVCGSSRPPGTVPNRLTAVGALCIGFALIAVISTAYASNVQTLAAAPTVRARARGVAG